MARPKGSKNKSSIVAPDIKTVGETNLMETAEKQGEMPILKSVGVGRLKPDSRDFISYVITSQGDKVLKMEVSEPNLKAIALDAGKISFVENFLNEEGLL